MYQLSRIVDINSCHNIHYLLLWYALTHAVVRTYSSRDIHAIMSWYTLTQVVVNITIFDKTFVDFLTF